jgi:hypothetical protein
MANRASVTAQTVKNGTTAGVSLLAVVLILVFVGAFLLLALGPGWLYPRDLSVRQLHDYPSIYVGQKVNVIGYLVKHTAPHFGDTYTLCEGDPRNLYFAENPCIGVSGEASPAIDPYLSFVYNGTNYEAAISPCSFAMPCRVIVSGVLIDRGRVTDASQYVIEASSVAWHE